MSALKNKLNKEKSVLVPNSTAFAAMSASIFTLHTLMCHEFDLDYTLITLLYMSQRNN